MLRSVSFLVLLAVTSTPARGWTFSAPPRPRNVASLVLSESSSSGSVDVEEIDPKTKLAQDLRRLFDVSEMAYTVMVREKDKGDDGRLTPDQLIAAIQKDDMFGEDFARYCDELAGEGDVAILDVGKFADDLQSSEPLPPEAELTIPGKGNYLVYLSFAEDIRATMRVVVD